MESIGPLIKRLRKEKKFTQTKLASLVHMSRATLSGIENNTVPEIGIRKVESILNVFGYTLTAVPLRRRPSLDDLSQRGFHDE